MKLMWTGYGGRKHPSEPLDVSAGSENGMISTWASGIVFDRVLLPEARFKRQ